MWDYLSKSNPPLMFFKDPLIKPINNVLMCYPNATKVS